MMLAVTGSHARLYGNQMWIEGKKTPRILLVLNKGKLSKLIDEINKLFCCKKRKEHIQ